MGPLSVLTVPGSARFGDSQQVAEPCQNQTKTTGIIDDRT